MSNRQPNSETFELGHYEIMQLEIALEIAISESTPGSPRPDYSNVDAAVLRDLRKMVAHRSAVSLTASVETL